MEVFSCFFQACRGAYCGAVDDEEEAAHGGAGEDGGSRVVSELAVAGVVDEVEFGLGARGGIVLGAVAVFARARGGGEAAEGCLGFLGHVGVGGGTVGELCSMT